MMGSNKWTAEQWAAIIGKDCNMLVAAAAGAGKTAVLVERIIRRITDPDNPVDIDKLLVMTFTNAAAAEMRERIAEAIATAFENDNISRNMQRQLILLNKANITTIHSFCLEVLRNNFDAVNLDIGFRIADETEAMLLKLEAIDELFEDYYADENSNEVFFDLLECYGGNRDDGAMREMVLNLFEFVQGIPWPVKWLNEMAECFGTAGPFNLPSNSQQVHDFGETPWGKVLAQNALLEFESLKGMMEQAIGMLKNAQGLEKHAGVCMEDLKYINVVIEACSKGNSLKWDELYKLVHGYEFPALPRCGKDADREKLDEARKIRDEVKYRVKKIKENLVPADSAEIREDMALIYPLIKGLVKVVIDFAKRYDEKKRKKSVVDFNDLEHFCLEILTERDEEGNIRPSKTALEYRERFTEILVDEYQDSNLVQEIIINIVSKIDEGKPNVFMVGDIKQSIYRFRQAKPELFLNKYNSYSPDDDSFFRKVLLFKNFRSRKEVIHAVNFIFRQIMSIYVGELDYTETEALYPGAVFTADDNSDDADTDAPVSWQTELHLVESEKSGETEMIEAGENSEEEKNADGEDDEEEMLDAVQCEAKIAGKRIMELVASGVKIYDKEKGTYRSIEYRDIVVLVRATKNWAEVFAGELLQYGIPVFADTGAGFFKSVEVQVILSLLKIIDNPLQDIPLLSVLRSPIASFNENDLAELRLADKKALLYDALKVLAHGGSNGDVNSPAAKKAAAFLENLQRWRDMSVYMSTDQLLWQLYSETSYYSIVGAMPAGERRQANLRILFEKARQFEETSYRGLFNFINFIERQRSSRGDMGSAKVLGEKDNVVRIMSIHKSKGLEFPVVILAGCGKKFNLQDMNKRILFHHELGFGPEVVDCRRRLSYPSVHKQAIKEKIKAETLSEEMRILYVAMTRAREKLIITGTVPSISGAFEKWLKTASADSYRIPAYYIMKGTCYLDWICPALLRHSGLKKREPLNNFDGHIDFIKQICSRHTGIMIDDPSMWDVRIWRRNDALNAKPTKKQDEESFLRWLDELAARDVDCEFSEEIARRLDWEYPYGHAVKVPAKVTVTELKRRFDKEFSEEMGILSEYPETLVKKPLFLEAKKGFSPAEAGSIMHFVMQHLDYKRNDIEAQVEDMVKRDLLTEQQAKVVDVVKIRSFLESFLGRRLVSAKSVYREVPFNIEIPCRELYKEMQDSLCRDETLLLQGVIDCYFEEEDGIVLLDYKTDYVKPGGIDEIRKRYKVQIDYYARALMKLTGKNVKEKYIYLFFTGDVVEF